jgi:hypothetical protein
MAPATQPTPSRLVLGAVVLGFVAAAALLGREIWDYVADAKQPVLRQGDLTSAFGSVAMLLFLGVIAYNSVRKAKR